MRHRLGIALYLNGDARAALEQFEETVRRSPDFARARYSLGVLLMTSGRRAKRGGRADWPGAVTRRPELRRGAPAAGGGSTSKTDGRTNRCLGGRAVSRLDPRVAEARLGVAMTLVRLRRYQEARDRLVEGMQAHPAQPEFARGLARLLAAAPDDRVRDGRRALTMTQQLLKEQQTLDVGETVAMTLAELGQYEQAVTFQREVMAAAAKAGRDEVVGRQMRESRALPTASTLPHAVAARRRQQLAMAVYALYFIHRIAWFSSAAITWAPT